MKEKFYSIKTLVNIAIRMGFYKNPIEL